MINVGDINGPSINGWGFDALLRRLFVGIYVRVEPEQPLRVPPDRARKRARMTRKA